MATTSINIKACKQVSETHNKREKELDYVRKELTPNNENWVLCTQAERRAEIRELVKEKTGRKMQAKAEALREGVVVIDERTTMEQLQELGRRFKERFGFETIQISIHRDEGHWVNAEGVSTGTKPTEQPREGDIWKPNLHAHMVFDWYNHDTGKSVKTSKQDARDMQTIAAEVLGMERGVASDKKHIDSLHYKIGQQQAELAQVREEAEAVKPNKVLKEAVEGFKTLVGASQREKAIKSLTEERNALKAQNKGQEGEISALKEKNERLQDKVESQESIIKSWEEVRRFDDQLRQKAINQGREEGRKQAERVADVEIGKANARADKAEDISASLWGTIKDALREHWSSAVDAVAWRLTNISHKFFTEEQVQTISFIMQIQKSRDAREFAKEQLMTEGEEKAKTMSGYYHGWADNVRRDIQAIADREQVRTMGRGMSR